jgi:hypothetical protein
VNDDGQDVNDDGQLFGRRSTAFDPPLAARIDGDTLTAEELEKRALGVVEQIESKEYAKEEGYIEQYLIDELLTSVGSKSSRRGTLVPGSVDGSRGARVVGEGVDLDSLPEIRIELVAVRNALHVEVANSLPRRGFEVKAAAEPPQELTSPFEVLREVMLSVRDPERAHGRQRRRSLLFQFVAIRWNELKGEFVDEPRRAVR